MMADGIGNVLLRNDSANVTEWNLDKVHLFEEYPEGLLRFAMACCFIFMFIGIPGNLITIIALSRYEKVSSSVFFNSTI